MAADFAAELRALLAQSREELSRSPEKANHWVVRVLHRPSPAKLIDLLTSRAEQIAALVEAAKDIHVKSDRDGQPVIIGMLALSDSLRAFDDISQGGDP